MEKVYILKNLENHKYYTGRFWDSYDKYTTDISNAEQFFNIEDIEKLLNPSDEDNINYFEDSDIFEIITLYVRLKK